MLGENDIVSVDSIRIITEIPHYLLEEFLDIDGLKGECVNILVRNASKPAFRAGYKSTLCITAPSKRFFELLAFYDLGDYKISYLEVAKDVMRSSMDEAKFESYRLKKTMMKKYALNPFSYDVRDRLHKIRLMLEKGMFSDLTNYLGGKFMKYVVYARISKIKSEPCIHSEWRIRGAYNIKKITGISTVEDCINFDLIGFYEEITSKYIYHAEINQNRFGKFLKGFDGRGKKYTKRQLIGIGIAASTFISVYKVTSTAELVGTIKKLKEEIKSQAGRRNAFQKMILSINSNCMFLDVISIE